MNYEIENNYDWKSELFKKIDSNIDIDISLCLISGEPLDLGYITLPCNHSFNYKSLYKELVIQKKSKSLFEINILRYNQIKCPYCRKIYNNLIPHLNITSCPKVHGINYPEKYCFDFHKCSHINKDNLSLCNKPAFYTKNGYFCNKHLKNEITYNQNDIDYNKLTIPFLKEILKKNNCKISGNKKELIERIKHNNIKNN